MIKGNRVTALAAGLTLLIAFSVAGYILGFGLGEQSGDKQAKTDTYAQHSQDEINGTCAGLDGNAQTECIVRVVEATNEHKRSQADLNAQRNMAKWALLMLIATIAMAIVTAFGVYYVWRTLNASEAATDAALKAVEVTRNAAEAELRPYILVTSVEWVETEVGKPSGIKIAFQNYGVTPAHRVRLSYQFGQAKWDKVSRKMSAIHLDMRISFPGEPDAVYFGVIAGGEDCITGPVFENGVPIKWQETMDSTDMVMVASVEIAYVGSIEAGELRYQQRRTRMNFHTVKGEGKDLSKFQVLGVDTVMT